MLQEKSDLLQTKRNRNGQKVRRSAPTENEQISFLQKEIALHHYSQTEKQTLKEELHILKTERQALLKESYEHSEVCVKMKRIIQSYKKPINRMSVLMKKTGNS